MTDELGASLPRIVSPIPGPRSTELAGRLARVESRNVTRLNPAPPFWIEARGANVRDADGNVFIDLTAGFGVAAAGHAHPAVAAAIAEQATRLAHGLGDVQPSEVKLRLVERLAALAPGDGWRVILGGSGAEAVEAALKTVHLRTGRRPLVAFDGSYHGLTAGALAVTGRMEFRLPFAPLLRPEVRFAPFPDAGGAAPEDDCRTALARVEDLIAGGPGGPAGAVVVEPLQGRGGVVEPPTGFLRGLRRLCDGHGALLVMDEIYTGFGRTGRWFACGREGVVPDILVVGKALAGGLPLSAVLGSPEIMTAWPPSAGEALHTSTFLGNPVACAAALAHLRVIEEEGLVDRAGILGERVRRRLESWRARLPVVDRIRGRGLMLGLVLAGEGAGERAGRIVEGSLRRGVILLQEGPAGDVLALTPPLSIPELLLDHALAIIEEEVAAAAPA